jgi:hypothetical protein
LKRRGCARQQGRQPFGRLLQGSANRHVLHDAGGGVTITGV